VNLLTEPEIWRASLIAIFAAISWGIGAGIAHLLYKDTLKENRLYIQQLLESLKELEK